MNIKKIYLIIGIALVIDSVLSLYWGNFKLNQFIDSFGTMSNSILGNSVRIIRGGCGILLIYFNYK